MTPKKMKLRNTLALCILLVTSALLQAQENKTTDFTLNEKVDSNTMLSVGYRAVPRSLTNSPLPIDVITSKEILSAGQNSLDKALTFRLPYFNSVNIPVSDATSLLDPYEIRGMGPSRMLVLINGKRKHTSALLYTETAPGYGESAVDIAAIPQHAIERIEILKDGASAQYGSDAIAGVMNIVLKEDAENGTLALNGGITGKGDGETFGVAFNNGNKIGKRGFVNYTVDLSKVALANRAGRVNAAGEFQDFGADLAVVEDFLSRNPDARNINGSPETTAAKFVLNTGYDIFKKKDADALNMEIYGNGAYTYKKMNSFDNYRTPYWRPLESFPYLGEFFPGENPANTGTYTDLFGNTFNGNGYDGYHPTFEGKFQDYNGTLGLHTNKKGWAVDASFTFGANEQTYQVSNSHNRSTMLNSDGTSYKYRQNGPLVFDVGGAKFSHMVGNIDVTKRFTDMIAIGFGSEFRRENFTIIPGSKASYRGYENYQGFGLDSFRGNEPDNSGTFNRHNFGTYAELALNLTDNLLINGTARLENYSDFGQVFVWKGSSQYKFMEDKVTLRAAVSTNFRAPTLHQIYTQKTYYGFSPGGIQVGGWVNNISRVARLLDLPQLGAEKSTNITVGLGIRPDDNWSFALDYYNIALKDRIILSSEITCGNSWDTRLCDLLVENNLSDIRFFSNALNSRTSGIDIGVTYNGLTVAPGTMNFNFSANYMIQNGREGAIKDLDIIEEAGQTVSNPTMEALFFTSRPKYKANLRIDYTIGKFDVFLNNTLFGPTQFKQAGLPAGLYTEFRPAVVTDLGLNYKITDRLSTVLHVNNLFNILPEWHFKSDNGTLPSQAQLDIYSNVITFNQRYAQTTQDGSQFSQLGTLFNLAINVKL